MTDQKKCTGMFQKKPEQFHSQLHDDCVGCQRKAVRDRSDHHGFFISPVALFKDGKCQARRHLER